MLYYTTQAFVLLSGRQKTGGAVTRHASVIVIDTSISSVSCLSLLYTHHHVALDVAPLPSRIMRVPEYGRSVAGSTIRTTTSHRCTSGKHVSVRARQERLELLGPRTQPHHGPLVDLELGGCNMPPQLLFAAPIQGLGATSLSEIFCGKREVHAIASICRLEWNPAYRLCRTTPRPHPRHHSGHLSFFLRTTPMLLRGSLTRFSRRPPAGRLLTKV